MLKLRVIHVVLFVETGFERRGGCNRREKSNIATREEVVCERKSKMATDFGDQLPDEEKVRLFSRP